jgi:hypothetical protein
MMRVSQRTRPAGCQRIADIARRAYRTQQSYVLAGFLMGAKSVGSGLLAILAALTVSPAPSRSTW